jgi:hypothetical protein
LTGTTSQHLIKLQNHLNNRREMHEYKQSKK